jgi:cellulose synthase/poly-beta-1,6-N-acetylglucosamine synthase-like glycosyltransferase
MAGRISAAGWFLAAGLIAALAPATARAADRHETVAGWTLDDVDSVPGDDSNRNVTMRKSGPDVTITYRPGETASGGSIQVNFTRCQGLNYGSGFSFDDPPASRAAQVRKEIDEAFAEFAHSCPAKDQGEAALMQGFDEAFRTIEAWVKEHPFVYPPDSADQADAPGTTDQPDAPSTASVPMI